MLAELPWLLDELDARIQNLARVTHGTIGRVRRPDELNMMDFDAAEFARKVRATLLKWVETVAERHTGRKPPALTTVDTKQLAQWLHANIDAIARLDLAKKSRHPLYDDINRLVGIDQKGGQLVAAINRHERHFAGMCPTITGKNHDGTPHECGRILYADTDEHTTQCPDCKQTIDVEKNRLRAARDRDLLPKDELLEVLTNIGEDATTQQINRWITARRLRIRGYLHDGNMVRFRVNEHSIALYSVARARKLRRRDQQLRRQNTPA
jgi:hypothetical protein